MVVLVTIIDWVVTQVVVTAVSGEVEVEGMIVSSIWGVVVLVVVALVLLVFALVRWVSALAVAVALPLPVALTLGVVLGDMGRKVEGGQK